jgi:hypothetical protein
LERSVGGVEGSMVASRWRIKGDGTAKPVEEVDCGMEFLGVILSECLPGKTCPRRVAHEVVVCD